MGLYDTTSTSVTNLTDGVATTSKQTQDTEISLYRTDWKKWHGYYRNTPGLQAVVDKVAEWACGRSIKAVEPNKQKILDNLKGFGKDTAQSIARNQIRTMKIGGDSFAEQIRNKRGELINLKPLSPGTIEIVTDKRGMLIGYNQIEWKTGGNGETEKTTIKNAIGELPTFAPEEIFHLPWNRIADECHGISTIEKLEPTILRIDEAEAVYQKIVRRNAKPIVIIEADTDNTTKISELKIKYKDLIDKDEAIVIPKDAVKLTDFSSKLNIDPLPWLIYLIKKFTIAEGVPEVILGSINSKDTEGAAKILYLAFEHVVTSTQIFFEEQWKSQIGFEIDLPAPPSIDPMVLVDNRKAGSTNAGGGNQPTDIDVRGQDK